jgi:hypothetical protein
MNSTCSTAAVGGTISLTHHACMPACGAACLWCRHLSPQQSAIIQLLPTWAQNWQFGAHLLVQELPRLCSLPRRQLRLHELGLGLAQGWCGSGPAGYNYISVSKCIVLLA